MSENKETNITTIEECLNKIPNGSRFTLAVLASERAGEIENGSPSAQRSEDHKSTIIALQEIASGTLDIDLVEDKLVKKLQKNTVVTPKTEKIVEQDESLISEMEELNEYIENANDFSLSEEEMIMLNNEDEIDFRK